MEKVFKIVGETGANIQLSKEAFSFFRRNVIHNIGMQKSKNFFYQFGWELGAYDAASVVEMNLPIVEKIRKGPQFHVQNGYISGYTSKNINIEVEENGIINNILTHGIWMDSFEGKMHLDLFGLSDSCTCFISTGYASGFLSTVCNKEIVVKEVKCIGKGDPYCEIVTKNIEQWDVEELENMGYFKYRPIVEELSETYDELLSQKELINNVVAFQMKMMEKIINNNYLESILKLTYDTLKLPVIVENENYELIRYYGLMEEEYNKLNADYLNYIKKEGEGWRYLSKMTHIQTRLQNRLVAPLIIEDNMLGYCSFLFDESDIQNIQKYQLYFDSIINTVLLFLLNEKSKYESIDRMKSSFFDDILDQRYSKDDIISRGRYINIDFELPFIILALDFNISNTTLKDEHKFITEIHEHIYSLSKDLNFHYLITNRDNNFIVYLQLDKTIQKESIIEQIYNSLVQNKNYHSLKIGVSSLGKDIMKLSRYYNEAVTALKLAIKYHVSYFRDLGLIGVFINQSDKELINTYAEEELGELYRQPTEKNIELLRTAYYFLLNGGNYKETMHDLSISLTGLRYRISKLETILNKNLRNPNEGYHLLILLKALIILNELDIAI